MDSWAYMQEKIWKWAIDQEFKALIDLGVFSHDHTLADLRQQETIDRVYADARRRQRRSERRRPSFRVSVIRESS